jgi:hypothetical protein
VDSLARLVEVRLSVIDQRRLEAVAPELDGEPVAHVARADYGHAVDARGRLVGGTVREHTGQSNALDMKVDVGWTSRSSAGPDQST